MHLSAARPVCCSQPTTVVQDGLTPTTPSGGLLNGACGYGQLSQNQWPFWNVVSLGPNNPVAYKGNKKGCGYCIQATCTGSVCLALTSVPCSADCLHSTCWLCIAELPPSCAVLGSCPARDTLGHRRLPHLCAQSAQLERTVLSEQLQQRPQRWYCERDIPAGELYCGV